MNLELLNLSVLFALTLFVVILTVRARPEDESVRLHLLLVQTALGTAMAIFEAGWVRYFGFGVGIVSVIECTRSFSKFPYK
ncbi:MAG: hypothetical protein KY476_21700 [Planctomycetes bacterium]|nr:hypothetical protein [Planctomycetota bacterium]